MRTHRSSEAGSAYVITLLALVVLTILALSLALVTQTEVQVGANEKTVNRTFYAADSGIGISVAEILANHDYGGRTVILNKVSVGAGAVLSTNVADRVTLSPAVQINQYPCNWCPQNQGGQQFFVTTFAVSSTAQRVAWNGSGDPPADATVLGQKTVRAMIEVQPWKPQTDAVATDPAALAQVGW
ncbi:MAG TPA: pilus assembly PilX N-terminal domain-containing protein [Thermoanaerobaculia bacterium]